MPRTLGDALLSGQGVERPFMCEVGSHSHETASVNVLKGLWVCYSCHASGVVDSNRVPTPDELLSFLQPEVAVREYAQSWLATFGAGGYWADRFPLWLCWYLGLGEDPWTGEGTYPVHTPGGRLAGVGRRQLSGVGPKYRYPYGWAASRSLFGTRGRFGLHHDVLLVGEGAADACAGWEVGCPSVAAYGSALNAPQVDLIKRATPRLVLLGQDADEAGELGAELSLTQLADHCEVVRVQWDPDAGDPAAMPAEDRIDCLLAAVDKSNYGQTQATSDTWRATARAVQSAYTEENEHG